MKTFDLKLGWECNNDCIHCVIYYYRQDDKINTTQQIVDLINEYSHVDAFILTGGEPTIRKDFFDIIKHIKSLNKKIYLQTNGRMLSDFDFAKESSKYIDHYLIAIHSYHPAIHDFITNRKDSWKETIDGIKNILLLMQKNKNIDIGTQFVINKFNSVNMIMSFDFMQSLIPGKKMNLTHPHADGSALINYKVTYPKYSEIKSELDKVIIKYHKLLNIESIPFCYLYPHHGLLSNLFLYNFDNEPKIGFNNSLNKDGKYITHDNIINDCNNYVISSLRKGPKCKECIFNTKCLGVRLEYLEIYKNELDLFPIKE